MAGLLIKELKARGLAKRISIVTPADLHVPWRREIGASSASSLPWFAPTSSAKYGTNPWPLRPDRYLGPASVSASRMWPATASCAAVGIS